MAGYPVLSAQTAVGVAMEVTPGTFVVPVHWVPVSSAKIEDVLKYFTDKAYRGLAAERYGDYQLAGNGVLEYAGPHYPDAASYWWKGMFGQDTVTAAPSATTTTGTNSAGATSLTITSGTGFVNNAAILIDTGANQEGNIILSGGGTTTLTLAMPLRYTHTAGATVLGNTMHQFTMAPNGTVTQVPSLSVYDRYVESQRDLTNCVVEDLTVKWKADGEVTYDTKLVSNLTNTDGTNRATSYTQIPPFVGWNAGTIIGNTLWTPIEEVEFSFKRKVAVVFGSNNQQNPVAIISTVMDFTGKATMFMESETQYNHFRNADNPKLQFALAGPCPGTIGAATASGLMVQATNCQFVKAPIERGKDYVQLVVDFAGEYNSTDAGPATAYLTNAYATI